MKPARSIHVPRSSLATVEILERADRISLRRDRRLQQVFLADRLSRPVEE